MSDVVLKRPTKLQREVAKMRYETAIILQQRKHAELRRVPRTPPTELIAQLAAERQEREAAIAAEDRKNNIRDWQVSAVGAVIIFTFLKLMAVV